ncbi:hypothetical protein HK102_003477, partial [Quaeritorhiza haematococci]
MRENIAILFLCVLFLVVLQNSKNVRGAILITAFDASGKQLFTTEKNTVPSSLGESNFQYARVQTLIVGNGTNVFGNGTKVFEIWIPWLYGTFYDGRAFVFASAMCDIVAENPELMAKISIVGWEAVTNRRICNGTDGGTLPCPDIIVLGTTQIPGRFYSGEVEPLNRYFEEYNEETGMVLQDDFVKASFYDYRIGDSWIGLPLVSDLRALFFNKNALSRQGAMYPPPFGAWAVPSGLSWNWDQFLDYAQKIKDFGLPNGFQIFSNYDEELVVLMPTLGRLANVQLMNANGTCGLRNQRWYDVLEKYLRQPLQKGIASYVIDTTKVNNNPVIQEFLNDKNPDKDVLSQSDAIKAIARINDNTCPPMNTMGIVPIGCIFDAIQYQRRNDIGYGFPPGHFTFIGGSGAIISKYSQNKDLAWGLLRRFLNHSTTYVRRTVALEGSPPPLASFGDYAVFSTPFYQFSKQVMKRGVPVQYPSAPYTNWPGLQEYKPFRLMIFEMLYKNFSAKVVTERACQIVEHLLAKPLRECGPTDYSIVVSDCLANSSVILSYVFNPSSPCRNGTFGTPTPIYDVACSYVSPESSYAIGSFVMSAVGALASAIYSIGFLFYRNKAAIKTATIEFCLVIFLGSILLYVSVFLQAGAPSHFLCIARPWFLSLGFGTLVGGFLVKMVRVETIYRSGRAATQPNRKRISLFAMLQQLVIILIFEIGALIALTTLDSPGVTQTTIELRGVGSYVQMQCKPFNQIPVVVLLAFNGMLIIYGCYIAWRSRNVPDAYNETKFIMAAMLLISFCAVASIPLAVVLTSVQAVYQLQSLAINFATIASMAIFAVPKLWMAYKNITPNRSGFNRAYMKGSIDNNNRSSPSSRADVNGHPATTSSQEQHSRSVSLRGKRVNSKGTLPSPNPHHILLADLNTTPKRSGSPLKDMNSSTESFGGGPSSSMGSGTNISNPTPLVHFRDVKRGNHVDPDTFFSYTENSLEVSIVADIDDEDGLDNSGKRINELSAPLARAGISIFYLSTYQTDFIFFKERRLSLVISTLQQCNFDFVDLGAWDQDQSQTIPIPRVSYIHHQHHLNGPLSMGSPLTTVGVLNIGDGGPVKINGGGVNGLVPQPAGNDDDGDDSRAPLSAGLDLRNGEGLGSWTPGAANGFNPEHGAHEVAGAESGEASGGSGGRIIDARRQSRASAHVDFGFSDGTAGGAGGAGADLPVLSQLPKKLVPGRPLRLFGLNREYMESWAMKVIKLMFYDGATDDDEDDNEEDKYGEEGGVNGVGINGTGHDRVDVRVYNDGGGGPGSKGGLATVSTTLMGGPAAADLLAAALQSTHLDPTTPTPPSTQDAPTGSGDAPHHSSHHHKHQRQRFFSYTSTEEGISLVADEDVLQGFPEHVLFASMVPKPLRCIQVDLKEYGLDRYGIVYSMSEPLAAAGINLLYLSTLMTANVLVNASDLKKTLFILEVLTSSSSSSSSSASASSVSLV